MNKKLIMLSTMTIGLAACAPSLPVPEESINVTRVSGFQTAGILANQEIVVHTYLKGDGTREEVAAQCDLVGRGYTTEFSTPVTVVIPSYGQASPAINITCTLGEDTSSTTLSAYNISRAERDEALRRTGSSQGLIGVVMAQAVTAATSQDREFDIWGYPDHAYINFTE